LSGRPPVPGNPGSSYALAPTFAPGESICVSIVLDEELIDRFAKLSGDINPLHMDAEEARAFGFPKRVAHGALLISYVSEVIGNRLPGTGAVWHRLEIDWPAPSFAGDVISVVATVLEYSAAARELRLGLEGTNQRGKVVMSGKAEVKIAARLQNTPSSDAGQRVVLLTGGSRGIGATIGEWLARRDYRVMIGFRESGTVAQAAVDRIRSSNGEAASVKVDVMDEDATYEAVRRTVATFGRVDVIVHAASPPLPKIKIEAARYADFEPFYRAYVGGAVALLSAAVPEMVRGGFGRFVALGTVAQRGTPPQGWAPYLAAKHALWGLIRSAAIELGPKGITCNMVSPGMTITDLTADISLRTKEVEAQRNPMRRLASPDDTANAVGFLVSDAAGFVNGVDLAVTGGAM
jgi:3-oxoacyl-[acyl-carrier protein] reductase